MNCAVVDTNVLLAANGKHPDVSAECILECINRLEGLQRAGVTVIDDAWYILREYLHKTQPNSPKGVGDVFLKWLLQNQCNTQRVQQVSITESAQDTFDEFPVSALQAAFDPPDRKFAAVANAHPNKPAIWQAADCKWLDWWPALHVQGVWVEFLCPIDTRHFYQRKFPDKALPALPVA